MTQEQKRESARRYREANREKIREYARNYYRANREELNAQRRQIERAENEKFKARRKAWMEKQDPERIKALNREKARRYRTSPTNHDTCLARCREYKKRHKDALRERRRENEILPANDNYIRHLLRIKKRDNVPQALIQAKREHLRLTRKLKSK